MIESKSREKAVIRGAFSLFLSTVLVKAVGLLYKIPLSYILGDEGMSYFNSAYTVYTFFYIISTAGIPKSISIICSEYVSRGETDKAEEVVKKAFKIFFALGTILSAVFLSISDILSVSIGNNGAYASMLAIAPSIAFICASGVLRGYCNGTFSFLPIAVSEIITAISRLIFGILFAYIAAKSGAATSTVSACSLLGATLGSVISLLYLMLCKKQRYFGKKAGQSRIGYVEAFQKVIRIAVPITLVGALGSIGSILDLALIMNLLRSGGYTDLESNILFGNYSTLVTPMLNLVAALVAPITTVMLPEVTSSKNDDTRTARSISSAFLVTVSIALPCTLAFLFLPGEILTLLFEDSSASLAEPLLFLLAPSVLFMSLVSVVNTALEARGRTTVPLLSLMIGTLLKLLITYFINRNGENGIIGAPIGTLFFYLSGLVFSLAYLIFISRVRLNMPNFCKVVLSCAVSSFIIILAKRFTEYGSTIQSLFLLGIFGATYFTILYFSGFLKDIKTIFTSK